MTVETRERTDQRNGFSPHKGVVRTNSGSPLLRVRQAPIPKVT